MEETIIYARKLAQRVGDELNIPVYCYEHAAFEEKRRNLANCRQGEYEGLKEKLSNPEWTPCFGPACFTESVKKSGATAIGARDFLVAVNYNLNTTSTRRANAIAFDVREKDVRKEKESNYQESLKDEGGSPIFIPHFKSNKSHRWYISEYGVAQVSMNLTDIPLHLHIAFYEVSVCQNKVSGNRMRNRGIGSKKVL